MELNNGITYSNLFKMWDKDKLAQIYVSDHKPNLSVCDNYYQIPEKIGKRNKTVSAAQGTNSTGQMSMIKSIIKTKVKNSETANYLRNIIWERKKWFNKEFIEWVQAFEPQHLFIVGGPTIITLIIANCVVKIFPTISITIYYTDDYILNRPKLGLVSRTNTRKVKSYIKQLDSNIVNIATISESLGKEYEKILKKPYKQLINPIEICNKHEANISGGEERPNFIVGYFGSLHSGRDLTLKVLLDSIISWNQINNPKINVFLYSSENNFRLVDDIKYSEVLFYQGSLTHPTALKTMGKVDATLHVESFKKENISKVKYSISTKIPEMLCYSNKILAIGPKEIESIKVLQTMDVEVVTEKNMVHEGLKHLTQKGYDTNSNRKKTIDSYGTKIMFENLLVLTKSYGK